MKNILQGKFGQRSNLDQTKYFGGHEAQEYWDFIIDESHIVKALRHVNEDRVEVKYQVEERFVEDMPTTSVVIAAWVTAQARLKLYTYLEKLGRRVLYMDTGLLFVKYNLCNIGIIMVIICVI